MIAIGNAIGISFGGSGGVDWASYANMYIKSRSDNVLVDDFGSNANILLPYYYKPTISGYASIADNGALDIGNDYDFTLCFWAKNETEEIGTTRGLIGKYDGTAIGGYGVGLGSTNGIYGIIRTSTNYFLAYDAGNFSILTSEWKHICMEIQQATKAFRMFINGVQYGPDTTFTGTFATMAIAKLFYVGRVTTGFTANSIASFSDVMIFRKLLTPTEKTTLVNRGYIASPLAYWPCTSPGYTLYDVSGNNYTLTKTLINTNYASMYGTGSRYCLDHGYQEYHHHIRTIQHPLKMDGSEHAISETTSYHKRAKIAGSSTGHNLADSLIEFSGTEWDRSDVTRFSSLARSAKIDYFYDAANPKRWHPEILNNLLFQSWANTGYKRINLVKITDHSYKDRTLLSEIITTDSELTESNYAKAIAYCNDTVFVDTYENDYLQWKMIPELVRAVNGAKYFKYEAGKVALSLDNGATYPYEKSIAGLTIICMAYIFDNGNILFAALVGGAAKMYLSTDNLANVAETSVLDLAGDAYSPVNANCYKWGSCPIVQTVGTKTVMAWANYNTLNANSIWYTINSGVTVKQCYLDGTTNPPSLNADNLHGIVWNPNTSKFWIYSGDGTDECNVIEGTYNDVADTWAWAKIAGDNDGGSALYTNKTYYKIGGFIFDGEFIHWASDSDDATRKAIYRCAPADFGVTPANYVKVFDNAVFLFDYRSLDGHYITSNLRSSVDEFHWILAKDKTKWIDIPLYNHVITTDYLNQFIFGIDSEGWIVSNAPDYNGTLKTKIK